MAIPSTQPAANAPSRSLGGKYRIEGELGSGGIGHVVAARNIELDLSVAVKFLRTEHRTPELIGRFAREARAMARLRSEYTTRILDVGTSDEVGPYIVMERLVGEDLATCLEREGALPMETAVDFAMMVLVALAEAHANGIVHRDIKPENVFLHDPGQNGAIVKLLDFGVSKVGLTGMTFGADVDLVKTTALIGSPLYMAPEQVRASNDIDGRTDLWAVGVMLYEMLTTQLPFNAASITELVVRVIEDEPPPLSTYFHAAPIELDQAIAKCLAKNPSDRWQNAVDLAVALAPFSSGEIPLPVSPSERLGPPSSGSLHDSAARLSRVASRASVRSLVSGRISNAAQAESVSVAMRSKVDTQASARKPSKLPLIGIVAALLAAAGGLTVVMLRSGAAIEPAQAAALPQAQDATGGARPAVAAAAVTPPTTGFVSIKSNPSGAQISIDGVENGVTPLLLNLQVGAHEIVISAPDRESQRVLVEVPADGKVAPIPVIELTAAKNTQFDPKRPWLKAILPVSRSGPVHSASASASAPSPSLHPASPLPTTPMSAPAAPAKTLPTTPMSAPAAPAKTVKIIDEKDQSNVRVIK